MAKNKERKQALEHHAAQINNRRIIYLHTAIDEMLPSVCSNLSVQGVNRGYNLVEQLYINVGDMLPGSVVKAIEEVRHDYQRLYLDILNGAKRKTYHVYVMSQKLKRFHALCIHGLHLIKFYNTLRISDKVSLETIGDDLEEGDANE